MGAAKKLKQDQKAFTLIHNQEHIRSKKRLYMTATSQSLSYQRQEQSKSFRTRNLFYG